MRRESARSADYAFPRSRLLPPSLSTTGFDEAPDHPWREAPADRIQPHEFARSFKGSAQAVAIDLKLGTLCGASDPRLDEVALGY